MIGVRGRNITRLALVLLLAMSARAEAQYNAPSDMGPCDVGTFKVSLANPPGSGLSACRIVIRDLLPNPTFEYVAGSTLVTLDGWSPPPTDDPVQQGLTLSWDIDTIIQSPYQLDPGETVDLEFQLLTVCGLTGTNAVRVEYENCATGQPLQQMDSSLINVPLVSPCPCQPPLGFGADPCGPATDLTFSFVCDGRRFTDFPMGMATASASIEPPPACWGDGPSVDNDVWYTWTNSLGVPAVFVATTDLPFNFGNSQVASYAACGGPPLSCQEDIGTTLLNWDRATHAAGSTVIYRFDGFGGSTSFDQAAFACLTAAPDDCGTANDLTGDFPCDGTPYLFEIIGMTMATASIAPPGSCWTDSSVDNDVWFTWTNTSGVPVDFIATTAMSPNVGDSQIAVFAGCFGPELGCNEDVAAFVRLSGVGPVTVAPGTSIAIQIDGNAGNAAFDRATFFCVPTSALCVDLVPAAVTPTLSCAADTVTASVDVSVANVGGAPNFSDFFINLSDTLNTVTSTFTGLGGGLPLFPGPPGLVTIPAFPVACGPCNRVFIAELDPLNAVTECDDFNNFGFFLLPVVFDDLAVTAVSPTLTCMGDGIGNASVDVTVANIGCVDLTVDFAVQLTDNDGHSVTATFTSLGGVLPLVAGGTRTVTLSTFAADCAPCSRTYTATVDPADAVCECDGTNNVLTSAPQTIPIVDLTVTAVSPTLTCMGDGTANASVDVTVANIGCGDLTVDFAVQLTDNDGHSMTATFTSLGGVLPLVAGGMRTVTLSTFAADCAPCSRTYTATVDPADAVCECDGTNNVLTSAPQTNPIVDLTVTAVSPTLTCVGTGNASVDVTVANIGCGDLTVDFAVQLTDNDGNSVTATFTSLGGVLPLVAGGTRTVTLSTFAADCAPCSRTYTATVDPADAVCECAGSNNSFTSPSVTVPIPNLTVTAVTPVMGCASDMANTNVTVGLQNVGCASQTGLTVQLTDGMSLQTTTFATPLPPSATGSLLFNFSGCSQCNPTFTATVDPANAVCECDNTNNVVAAAPVAVSVPDLAVTGVTPVLSCSNDAVRADVTVGFQNIGCATQTGFDVRLTDGTSPQTTTFSTPLPPSAAGSLVFNFSGCSQCNPTFTATVDPTDAVCECDGTNNLRATAPVAVSIPDLTVVSIAPVASCISNSTGATVDVVVRNVGCAASGNFDVQLTDGINTRTMSAGPLAANGTQVVTFSSFPADCTACNRTYTAIVDPLNGVCECDGNNNSLSMVGTSPVPDLTVRSVSAVTDCVADGAATTTITAVIDNVGCGPQVSDFAIAVRDDAGNALTQTTFRDLGGPQTLAAGGSQAVTITLPASCANCSPAFTVIADPAGTVCECIETNNAATSASVPTAIANLTATSIAVAQSCAEALGAQATVTVANDGCFDQNDDFQLTVTNGQGTTVTQSWKELRGSLPLPAGTESTVRIDLPLNCLDCQPRFTATVDAAQDVCECEVDAEVSTTLALQVPSLVVDAIEPKLTCALGGAVSGVIAVEVSISGGCGEVGTAQVALRVDDGVADHDLGTREAKLVAGLSTQLEFPFTATVTCTDCSLKVRAEIISSNAGSCRCDMTAPIFELPVELSCPPPPTTPVRPRREGEYACCLSIDAPLPIDVEVHPIERQLAFSTADAMALSSELELLASQWQSDRNGSMAAFAHSKARTAAAAEGLSEAIFTSITLESTRGLDMSYAPGVRGGPSTTVGETSKADIAAAARTAATNRLQSMAATHGVATPTHMPRLLELDGEFPGDDPLSPSAAGLSMLRQSQELAGANSQQPQDRFRADVVRWQIEEKVALVSKLLHQPESGGPPYLPARYREDAGASIQVDPAAGPAELYDAASMLRSLSFARAELRRLRRPVGPDHEALMKTLWQSIDAYHFDRDSGAYVATSKLAGGSRRVTAVDGMALTRALTSIAHENPDLEFAADVRERLRRHVTFVRSHLVAADGGVAEAYDLDEDEPVGPGRGLLAEASVLLTLLAVDDDLQTPAKIYDYMRDNLWDERFSTFRDRPSGSTVASTRDATLGSATAIGALRDLSMRLPDGSRRDEVEWLLQRQVDTLVAGTDLPSADDGSAVASRQSEAAGALDRWLQSRRGADSAAGPSAARDQEPVLTTRVTVGSERTPPSNRTDADLTNVLSAIVSGGRPATASTMLASSHLSEVGERLVREAPDLARASDVDEATLRELGEALVATADATVIEWTMLSGRGVPLLQSDPVADLARRSRLSPAQALDRWLADAAKQAGLRSVPAIPHAVFLEHDVGRSRFEPGPADDLQMPSSGWVVLETVAYTLREQLRFLRAHRGDQGMDGYLARVMGLQVAAKVGFLDRFAANAKARGLSGLPDRMRLVQDSDGALIDIDCGDGTRTAQGQLALLLVLTELSQLDETSAALIPDVSLARAQPAKPASVRQRVAPLIPPLWSFVLEHGSDLVATEVAR